MLFVSILLSTALLPLYPKEFATKTWIVDGEKGAYEALEWNTGFVSYAHALEYKSWDEHSRLKTRLKIISTIMCLGLSAGFFSFFRKKFFLSDK
jgi:hypothetical protein